ncbi:MAG: DUF1553 domain-containing protein [Verrucomicrobiales bacterium]|nr:DUF1553 domain-containing protein [Verrucomicrobiales bacterium]
MNRLLRGTGARSSSATSVLGACGVVCLLIAWSVTTTASEPATNASSGSHWAFQAVSQPQLPVVRTEAARGWIRNEIDAFIAARLEREGLSPSPEADRRTLLRRLSFDLTGLPPSHEEVLAFEADVAPGAYERRVEALLASPRHGERWARVWLDAIAFGETHGFEVNTPRENAWPFRDYVIHALNTDKPYPEFLRDQFAGDVTGEDAATGFLVAAAALLPGQVGKDEESIRLARQDELHAMIVGAGSTVLGLTVGCARCHDHKFDPISQDDYYAFQAALAGVRYGERTLRPGTPGGFGATNVFAGRFDAHPEPTYRLQRGDPMQRRDQVTAAVLSRVAPPREIPPDTPEPQRRLALVDWMTDPRNPLTPRVLVNRLWLAHFGEGIVSTPSDFGVNGARAEHPELLDWLATRLRDDGWSLKSLHRRIVTSATYRQSNRPRQEAVAKDAGTRWLWRFPPRRLDAEMIRDAILATSGLLDLRMGGRGFSVFKPNDNYVRVYDPKETFSPDDWRRMIYATKVRMAQDGTFGAFDCPDAGQIQPKRPRSTTAIQALNLFNSPFVHEQARAFADRVRTGSGTTPDAQVKRAFELALGRPPHPEEWRVSHSLVLEHGLPTLCRVLFNSNEFLHLP